MDASKLLGIIERRASAQMTRLLNAAWKHYGRLSRSAAKVTDVEQQRRYIRAVRQTIASAEKIIAQLKQRVDAVESLLGSASRRRPATRAKRSARRATRTVRRTAKRVASRARRRARG